MPPSYNVIEIDADEVSIALRQPGQGAQGEEPLARFARRPVITSRFYPELERFVRYDADPFPPPRRGGPSTPAEPLTRETGPTITAVLEGGPLGGRRVDAEVVEGRPPKTIDLPADDGSTCRYGLAEWAQTGSSAVYAFLYRI
jgi:hypothetical protein